MANVGRPKPGTKAISSVPARLQQMQQNEGGNASSPVAEANKSTPITNKWSAANSSASEVKTTSNPGGTPKWAAGRGVATSFNVRQEEIENAIKKPPSAVTDSKPQSEAHKKPPVKTAIKPVTTPAKSPVSTVKPTMEASKPQPPMKPTIDQQKKSSDALNVTPANGPNRSPSAVKTQNTSISPMGSTPATSPPATSPPSSSSSLTNSAEPLPTNHNSSENERGMFDFKSQMMKSRKSITSVSLSNSQVERSPFSELTSSNEVVEKVPKPIQSLIKSFTTTSNLADSQTSPKPENVMMRSTEGKDKATHEMKRQSSDVIIRKTDQKQFKKLKLAPFSPAILPPDKPVLPDNVNLNRIKEEYEKMCKQFTSESTSDTLNDETDDNIYDDGSTVPERISLIPDMNPAEEGLIYDDGETVANTGYGLYTDGETEKETVEPETNDIYEEEGSFAQPQESEEDKKKRLKEEADAKKREEKEKKEKEKEEEKKRKKEEKDKKEALKKLKKFGLTGNEPKVGEGQIKQDAKGSGQNLTVKKGQTAMILRLDHNPANKWLVQVETNIGYVDNSNIDIDPTIIKKAMGNLGKDSNVSGDDLDQPTYDDVPNDGAAAPDHESDGEIYEEL